MPETYGSTDALRSGKGEHLKEEMDIRSSSPAAVNGKSDHAAGDEDKEQDQDPAVDGKKVDAAKKRHQDDLAKHAYEPPKAEKPQDDWQVAYIWAFIVKFNQRDRIRKLECLEDFERALLEPIPNRPDDILEGILIRFIQNLKPGTRNIDCENVEKYVSSYIEDHLQHSTEFTVWDRPWAPNEEARGGCCLSASDRQELGRLRYTGEPAGERVAKNPLKDISKGRGLFELDWRERVKIFRQLVDWQLTDSDHIRAIINSQNHQALPKGVKVPEAQEKVAVEPIGMDKDKQRIWAFDNSGRIYRSGNPFRRPCPFIAISSNKDEFAARVEEWRQYGESSLPPRPSKKMSKSEQQAYSKEVKGIKMERELGERAEAMLDAVEKEEQRIVRARKRAADANRLYQQAEIRSTRTRRQAKKVDYAYDGFDDEEDEAPRRSGRSTVYEQAQPSRPVIPGERKSARQAAREAREAENDEEADNASYIDAEVGDDAQTGVPDTDGAISNGNGSGDADQTHSSTQAIDVDEDENGRKKKRKNAKGWEWIEEDVDVEDPTGTEREVYERKRALAESSRVDHATIAAPNGNGYGNGANAEGAIEID